LFRQNWINLLLNYTHRLYNVLIKYEYVSIKVILKLFLNSDVINTLNLFNWIMIVDARIIEEITHWIFFIVGSWYGHKPTEDKKTWCIL